MVLNAAVQMLREADDLKQKILQFKNGTSMLHEKTLWALQQQLQKVYEKVLVLDLDYALDKKVEQDLWNVGFKQQIEALQAISKDRKNAMRSEGQAMLSWVLQAAAGFYLCLLHQICTTFKLDLPFRRRASLLGWVEGWGAGPAPPARAPPPPAARYICQHCLVHLGDLARYRQQLRSAHTFYRHALLVSAHSGQPYNQLALVSWRRGRRLGALYWHVRSLLVRAPFPPAPANLARTLRAAASHDNRDLPVIPGVTPSASMFANKSAEPAASKLDSHSYVTELIRAMHLIHTLEDLETASAIVKNLDSSLTTLVATDSFESMTLIKMACVLIWLVHSSTEDLALDKKSMTDSEAKAAALSESLAASALQALLLPAYTAPEPLERTLPALKVWMSWVCGGAAWAARGAAWAARPQLWAALAHVLNRLPTHALDHYDTVPLPEDEELQGFLPLEESLAGLKFCAHAAWDTYAGRLPGDDHGDDLLSPSETPSPCCLSRDAELQRRLRARRLRALGEKLADLLPEHLHCTYVDSTATFSAASVDGPALMSALAELSLTSQPVTDATVTSRPATEASVPSNPVAEASQPELSVTSEHVTDRTESVSPPLTPTVISEADFREKVREKRVGILKPQGSLERAREERALATQDDQDSEGLSELVLSEDKKESRKARVNIAMAAIMRKQEETNKQVKFVTPPPTPDSTAESTDSQDQPKILQPKSVKSLANIPVGRKTGGILSLKDKSAGYPHLVNIEPEPKKTEKDEKKEIKLSQNSSQNSQQNYQPKRLEHPTSPNWPTSMPPPNYPEPRNFQPGNFQKNYGIQNAGLSYNPNYQMPSNQGIRLPVVNPKEIDVRTAALQKQNARQELFQDGAKFGHSYQNVSGDKKNFLNDLPPRFANQYRYWQTAQENQFNDNKFRDDNFKTNTFNPQQQPPNWMNTAQDVSGNFQQPVSWWPKQENPSFPQNFQMPMNIQPNFYNPPAQLPNPYAFNQMPSQNKPDNFNYNTTIGPPQMQTLQNLVSSSSFNSLNNFGSYQPAVSYDSSMYPQFNNKMYQPVQKPGYSDSTMMDTMNFGSNASSMQQRSMSFGEQAKSEGKNADQPPTEGARALEASSGNTYSLFSGAEPASWGAHQHAPQQSLWSGPSPLERLLEQQKQMKQPPAPQ